MAQEGILVVLPSARGGCGQEMCSLGSGLAARGVPVRVLILDGVLPAYRGRCTYFTGSGFPARVIQRAIRFPATVLLLHRLIRELAPSLVLTAGLYCNLLGLISRGLPRRIRSTPVVITEHDIVDARLKTRAYGALAVRAMRIAYPSADCIVAVSSAALQSLVALIGRQPNMRRIYNGLDESLVRSQAAAAPLVDLPTRPYIVAVGRLSPEKNLPLLLEACALLRDRLEIETLIVGDGPERERLETLCSALGLSDLVAFSGHLQNPLPVIQASALFVQTSHYEGFGLAMLEAMVLGKPILAVASSGGALELLDDGRSGRLVEPANPEALARAAQEILSNPQIAQRLSELAKQRSRSFSFDRMVDSYFLLISSLTNQHGSSI
ncbi:MAG: glycosyltransferase [Candidatus Marsarchaeota archaeon]|nr:glycosyltransferase [Candidatus Marsarchaeota archaeon]